jgi:hypothetical protein
MPKSKPSADEIESALGVNAPNVEQLKSIEQLVNGGIALVQRIEKGEALLKELKAQLHQLTTVTLPDQMSSAGTSLFKNEEGWKVEVKPFVAGSLPKEEEKRTAALEWIRSVQAGDIIKNRLAVEFERGEDNIAGEIKAKLDELGMDYELKEDVHPQTLLSFARERMKGGEEVPLETLGLYAGRNAKIEPPKRRK